MPWKMLQKHGNIILLLIFLANLIVAMAQPCTFCRPNHVGVLFDPRVSVEDIMAPPCYNSTDLLPFLSIISQEFETVVIDDAYYSDYSQSANAVMETVTAVANWNHRALSFNETFLEAWLIRQTLKPWNTTEMQIYSNNWFHVPNKIFKNSVTKLIVYVKPSNFGSTVSNLRKYLPRPDYQIGIGLSVKSFETFTLQPAVLKEIQTYLHLVDFIFFHHFSLDEITTNNLDSVPDNQFNLVEKYINSLKPHYQHFLSFGMLLKWPDTSEQGIVSYTKQVEFWKKAVNLGRERNLTIIFNSAFDTPFRQIPMQRTTGWWRFLESSKYTATSQFKFQDKQSLAKSEEYKALQLANELQQDLNFEHDYFAVNFKPVELSFASSNNSQQLSLMYSLVEKIATRFLSIKVSYGKIHKNYTVFTEILKQHQSLNPSFPLKVIVSISEKYFNDSDLISNLQSYKMPKELLLFPTNLSKIQNLKSRFLSNQSNTLPEIALVLDINLCSILHENIKNLAGWYKELTTEAETFAEYIKNFDAIYFDVLVGSIKYLGYVGFDVDRVYDQLTARMQKCQQRVAMISPKIRVAFRTAYPDSLVPGTNDRGYASFALFWKKMNTWARNTSTKIIMHDAFDTSTNKHYQNQKVGLGWWKLIHNPNHSHNFSFLEKHLVALKNLQAANTNKTAENQLQDSFFVTRNLIIAAIVLISVVTILLLSANILLRKRHAVLKPTPSMIQVWISEAGIPNTLPIIRSNNFDLGTAKLVGAGQFGTIYKCYIPCFKGNVAVKVPSSRKAGAAQETSVKSLISEMKIMSTVGQHQNVLQLLGICIEDQLFLVTEYCENGSLLHMLRKMAKHNLLPDTYQLLQYCMEISAGMYFLGENHVIHGDLSARNVLIDCNNNCKICDFGLSRKLEQYELYRKKGEEPLPWRWMAYESLLRLEFSIKSDMWSMGVTFWEVFTLGQIPFPEMRWNGNFCSLLFNGLRLQQPNLCSDAMYNLMLACWSIDRNARPTSKDIHFQVNELRKEEYEKFYICK